MAKTREIKRRMKAVSNIQRITKTMQMIATARFQASQKRATAAKPFTSKIAELVGELSSVAQQEGGSVSHPLLKSPDPAVNRELVLVLTSSRGLCGGYNANILRVANQYRQSLLAQGKDIALEVVGKKGVAYFRFNRIAVSTVHSQFGDEPKYEEVERLAERYMAEFTEGQYDAVRVIYMAFESMSRQSPHVLQLLPLEDPTRKVAEDDTTAATAPAADAAVDYDFSPEPAELLAELLPLTVKGQLFQCFNEALVSEQIARMIAMKAATDAAKDMRRDLGRAYNRARQTAITTELSEIIAGAAALG